MLTRRTICGTALAALLAGCELQEFDPTDKRVVQTPTDDAAARSVISADGVSISFEVEGRGETALVFIHGWSCDSGYWRAQLPAFSNAYTTVAVDLAGHGLSGANRRDWSMAAFGEDVAAVIRALPHRHVILIGHSMGGYVALEAARLQPERVMGVIGVDSLQDLDGQQPDPEGAAALLTALRRQPRETTRSFVLETFFTPRSDPSLARQIADDMASAPPSVAVPSMEMLMAYDPKPVAASLDIPVVAIVGEMMPVDERAARDRVPRFRAQKIPGGGHFLHIEQPEIFNAMLREEIGLMAADLGVDHETRRPAA